MRFALGCLIWLQVASAGAFADERASPPPLAPSAADSIGAANRLRYAGIALLVVGVVATVVSQVLVAEGAGWELGNGLGEHYDPTPSWVPVTENTGWALLAGGQAAIISGIVMLCVGTDRRNEARTNLSFSVTPTRTGGLVSLVARF